MRRATTLPNTTHRMCDALASLGAAITVTCMLPAAATIMCERHRLGR